MAAIDVWPITPLDERDLTQGLALSAGSGWNQVADDWRMMIREGHASGCRDAQDGLIASALALPFGDKIGWVSMVLVAADWRRRGIASRLVQHSVEWLENQAKTPLLDATPDGARVYRGMGFRTVAQITRWQRTGSGPAAAAGTQLFQNVTAELLPDVLKLDREVFGADRAFVLRDLTARTGAVALATRDQTRGFVLTRRGRLATQIGPLVADDEALAIALADATLAQIDGAAFIDVFDHQTALVGHLQALGFTMQRPFERMIRGTLDFGVPEARYFAVAGPELG